MSGEEYGSLGGHSRRPRKMDVWKFRSPYHDSKSTEANYTATISLVTVWNYKEGHSLKFRATSKHFESDIEDTDIQKLHDRVKREFEKQDMKARCVEWEDWIELEVKGGAPHFAEEFGNEISIEYRYLKRGAHPDTGELFTINNNHVVVSFPKPKLAGENDSGKPDDEWHLGSRDVETQFSYIRSTPENIAALESLCKRICDVRSKLAGLLNQKTAQESLARNVWLALPKPEAGK